MFGLSEPARRAQRGFSLIELMVTLAIVATLATIAVASYQTQSRKSRRTEARSALLDLAGREEKLFSVNNAYSGAAANLGYASLPSTVGSGYYQVSVSVPDPTQAATTSTTFLLTATAVGIQAKDTACASLTLNQLGQQNSTGTGTAATCWTN